MKMLDISIIELCIMNLNLLLSPEANGFPVEHCGM
jgi:hypothetical protein